MIDVWGVPVMADIEYITDFLITELRASGSHLLKDKKYTSKNIMLTCISHKNGMEATPSMGIMTEDVRRENVTYKAGTVNCFVCGYTCDLAEFVSNCFGYKDAGYFGFKWITSHFVNLSIENRKDIPLDMSRNKHSDERRDAISEVELASYRFIHPYMYERKLTDKVIEYFDVGYDRENDCLTFPVHDYPSGLPIFLQRRSVSKKRFQNDVTTLKGSVLYGLYHVYRNLSWIKEVYVTESIIDALTLWTRRKAAVATLQAIPTTTQLDLLRKLPVRQIVCAHDNDDAGDAGAKRIKEQIGDQILVNRAIFGEKDINMLTEDEIDNLRSYIM